MMQEDYVSFEQAKLLKEKGFPQDLDLDKWVLDSELGKPILASEQEPVTYFKIDTILCIKPTLSLVQKWLIEEKGIDIIVQKLIRTPKIDSFYMAIVILEDITQETFAPYNTYEEALSSGISKALELI